MQEKRVEGVVLRSQDYKEKERLITLFTNEKGLIHLIVKKISKKQCELLSLTALFSQGEFLYLEGRTELYIFHSGHLIDGHLDLRSNLRYLQTAGAFVKALTHSQLPGKPAPFLYSLLVCYLKQIPALSEHKGFTYSFYFKVLRHEGLITPTGESPESLNLFSQEERNILKVLISTRSFKEFKTIFLPSTLEKKIEKFLNFTRDLRDNQGFNEF